MQILYSFNYYKTLIITYYIVVIQYVIYIFSIMFKRKNVFNGRDNDVV